MTEHASDCAVHNEPAYPAGPCSCGAEQAERAAALAMANDIEARRLVLAFAYDSNVIVRDADVLLSRALRLLAEQSAPSPAPADLREVVKGVLMELSTTADFAEMASALILSRTTAAGCVILPREPTQAMFRAAEKAGVSFQSQQRCWNAFVSAIATKE